MANVAGAVRHSDSSVKGMVMWNVTPCTATVVGASYQTAGRHIRGCNLNVHCQGTIYLLISSLQILITCLEDISVAPDRKAFTFSQITPSARSHH